MGSKDQQAHWGRQVQQEWLGNQVFQASLAFPVTGVVQELQAIPGPQVFRAHLALLELQALPERLENKEVPGLLGSQDPLDQQAQWEV
jgi:hypothetical protein